MKVWKKSQESESPAAMENYLHKATINSALSYLESRKKVVPITEKISSTQIDSSDQVSYGELEKHVLRAIDKLPPQRKAVFVLSRFEGMKYQQIAYYLDISVKTVESHMGKALRDLREDLKPFLTTEFISAVIAAGITCMAPYLGILIALRLIL
jgi:RNA polymerase sigma-70 factor (ECF subfamily)